MPADTPMVPEVEYEVWQDDMPVASADRLADAQHYMAMYGQDGPVKAMTAFTYRVDGFTAVSPLSASPAQGEGEAWYGDRDPHEVDQAYGEYDGTSCELCGRERVMVGGATGKRICEKCGHYQSARGEGALGSLQPSASVPTEQAEGPVVGWQPIETAPRDGESILAICATAYSPVAGVTWWQDGWTHYSRPAEKWHGGVGKWFPTHWMPLPEAPSTTITAEQVERRCCDECGFSGSADEAHPLVDCCSQCGENTKRGGEDRCVSCGAENCMGYACPTCGGRYALDEPEEAPPTKHRPECWGRTSYSEEMAHCFCPSPGEGEAPVAFDAGDDLHFAIYSAAYAILRDYDNHPEGDRGLIRAGDYRIPKLIAATAAAAILRTRPTPATPEGLREAVRKVGLWVKCGMPDQSDDTPRRDALRRDLQTILSALQPQGGEG